MPVARIITNKPDAVSEVAQALSECGYDVDVVSPAHIPNTSVDLEINLRNHEADLSSHDPQAPEWESSEYDVPIEREFILAPAWRSLTSRVKDSWNTLRPPRPHRSQNEEQSAPIPVPVSIPAENIAPAPARRRRSLALNAYLSKFKNQTMIVLAKLPPLLAKARIQTTSLMLATRAPFAKFATLTRSRTGQIGGSISAWRNHMPRSEGAAHTPALAKPTRDYLWHQSWPIAAGILFAFLLGWVAATHSSEPANRVLQPAAAMGVVSPGVPARQIQKPRAQRKILNATAAPKTKPTAVRKSGPKSEPKDDADDIAQDEVTVRHYPSKAVTAQNRQQQQHPKHYSDLE